MIWVEVPYNGIKQGGKVSFLLDLQDGIISSILSPCETIYWEVVETEGEILDKDYRMLEQEAFKLGEIKARELYTKLVL
jgi:hypothetical protein